MHRWFRFQYSSNTRCSSQTLIFFVIKFKYIIIIIIIILFIYIILYYFLNYNSNHVSTRITLKMYIFNEILY